MSAMLKTIALTFAALLASASFALACSCVRFRDAAEQIAGVDVAFIGVAQKTERAGLMTSDRVTTFRVSETLKGAAGRTVRVRHQIGDGGNCGISFRRNTPLLVFAHKQGSVLTTGRCSAPRFPEAEYRAALR